MTDRHASSDDQISPVKRALIEIRDLRARLARAEAEKSAPIAVVGIGLRFPGGVTNAEGFARLLWNGTDAVGPIPSDRWSLDQLYAEDPDAPGKMITRCGAFIEDVDKFDADFFGIAPREAVTMDPQQRLLLEIGWEALENAGHSPAALAGSRGGVYLGISNGDYGRSLLAQTDLIDAYASSGNAYSVAAGRLSYFLGLHGPSMAVDTACSSSLVALHLACQGLRLGECDLALAGGINLILSPEMNISFSKARMMAPDGRCKTFDAAADGYVRGEGCGILVLRRLADALGDGDRILALVRGSAVNQDGRSAGLTAPNGPAQEAVIRAALSAAGLPTTEVGYVEAHGTGTALGDPIEVGALEAVFSPGRDPGRPLAIGSVKTNIGHL
jgi:acyl transferase domain-containing protein